MSATSLPRKPDLIDRAYLARQTSRDAALAREVLALFSAQVEALLGELDATGGASGALPLHKLRGAASSVGAFPLAERLTAAEAAPGDADALCRLKASARETLAAARGIGE